MSSSIAKMSFRYSFFFCL